MNAWNICRRAGFAMWAHIALIGATLLPVAYYGNIPLPLTDHTDEIVVGIAMATGLILIFALPWTGRGIVTGSWPGTPRSA